MQDWISQFVGYLLVAFVAGGITYFWNHFGERGKRKEQINKIAKDVNEMKHDFKNVKNCTRLTSKTYLEFYTRYFVSEGGIPLKSRATLISLAEELHEMGENGDVSACIHELEKLPTNEDIEIK